jgi:hypothetical protein
LKRILGYTSLISALFIAAAPSLVGMPEFCALFPRFAEFYATIESIALRLIPDEIEEIVATISEKLN